MQTPTRDISPQFVGSTLDERIITKRLIKLEGTPEAIREFTRQRKKLGDYTYWFLLGTLWVKYTGFSDLKVWKRLFSAERPNRDECLMKPSELAVLDSLPAEFNIYRAHRPGETEWIAYTLKVETACRFAIERGVKELKAYVVKRDDVLALFLRRGEYEVLVLDQDKPQYIATVPMVAHEPEPEDD